MKITIVNACSDLGVKINGSDKGPIALNNYKDVVDNIVTINKDNVEKELDEGNKKRNIKYVNKFNEELYNAIVNDENFIITIGGDHSIAIGSDLASKKKYDNIGLIWIDAHSDFHNMDSTITGNIHGMPFATIAGQNGNELSYFFDGEYYKPENVVLVGGRDIEAPEYINLENAGVKIFTTEDIKKLGVKQVMDEAFLIACDETDGLHISYDLDVIDPLIAPGVSVKAPNGINEKEAYEIANEIIDKAALLKSFDLVEYNPDYDIDNKTKIIGQTILDKIINAKK
jgi:arginase